MFKKKKIFSSIWNIRDNSRCKNRTRAAWKGHNVMMVKICQFYLVHKEVVSSAENSSSQSDTVRCAKNRRSV